MRAKTVPQDKAYVFDFDDTLVKTEAKVHIYKDGKRIKSLTPEQYNTYVPQDGEEANMDDFIDPRIIMNAKKYKMWPALKNIDMAKKSGRSESEIFILTARSPKAQLPIWNFLTREGIKMPLENVMTLGRDDGEYYDIAAAKKKVLSALADKYDKVLFFDDSEKNIELASRIPGIKSRLIEINSELPKKKWVNVNPDQHSDELIDLVQTAYKKAPEGSFINSKSDLNGSDWHSIDFDDEPDVDATIFYRLPRNGEQWKGKKIQGVGHDGSRPAIGIMLNRLKTLLNNNGVWVEASDALEHIFYKIGVPYVDDEMFAQEIFPNTDLEFTGDRGKYTRNVGSKKVKETIFGKPKI